jgi:hypothetical protein
MRREERLVVTIIAGINIVLLLVFVPFPAFAHQFKWVASVDGVRRFVVSALNVFSITRGNNSSDWLGRILVWIISWVFWILIPLTGFVWLLKTSRGIATFASKNHAAVICRAPGWGLNRFAGWFFSRRTLEEVLQPVLADMQAEFVEAVSEGRIYKARWVQLRGYVRFWTHVAAQCPVSIVRVAARLWSSTP